MNRKGQQWVTSIKKALREFEELKEKGTISEIDAALSEIYIRTIDRADGVTASEYNKIGESIRLLLLEHGERIGVKHWIP